MSKDYRIPDFGFTPHPNLSDEINKNIAQSEVNGGYFLRDVLEGKKFEIETQNTRYTLEKKDGKIFLSGNPKFCHNPTEVRIKGSTWGGSMLKMDFIGIGMHLEFVLPNHETITTTQIKAIRELQPKSQIS
ncbi:MAG: hypothetical protein AAB522_00610 [Patescibacteria group bacterium]